MLWLIGKVDRWMERSVTINVSIVLYCIGIASDRHMMVRDDTAVNVACLVKDACVY